MYQVKDFPFRLRPSYMTWSQPQAYEMSMGKEDPRKKGDKKIDNNKKGYKRTNIGINDTPFWNQKNQKTWLNLANLFSYDKQLFLESNPKPNQ